MRIFPQVLLPWSYIVHTICIFQNCYHAFLPFILSIVPMLDNHLEMFCPV